MKNKKENILNFIKLFLLLVMMVNGFFFVYALIWFAVGLPQENWAIWVLYAIAGLTEYGYCRLLRGDTE